MILSIYFSSKNFPPMKVLNHAYLDSSVKL